MLIINKGKEKKIVWSIGKIKYNEEILSEIDENVIVMIRAIENFNSVCVF